MKTKHTQGKWELHPTAYANVQNENGRSVANCGGYASNVNSETICEENEANAAFIVTACNNHYKLMEALKEATLQLEYLHDKFRKTASGSAVISRLNTLLKQIENNT